MRRSYGTVRRPVSYTHLDVYKRQVKRTDSLSNGAAGKMYVDCGGQQGFVPHKSFYSEQVGSIFI